MLWDALMGLVALGTTGTQPNMQSTHTHTDEGGRSEKNPGAEENVQFGPQNVPFCFVVELCLKYLCVL